MHTLSVNVIVAETARAGGRIRYEYPDVFGETEFHYAQDVWTCWLGKLALSCTAWRQVLTVHGFLPHQVWRQVAALHAPDAASASFIVDAPFDPTTRVLLVECTPKVEYERTARTLRVSLLGHDRCDVYVRPHDGLILGASRAGKELVLSEVWLIDVEVTADAETRKPRPW